MDVDAPSKTERRACRPCRSHGADGRPLKRRSGSSHSRIMRRTFDSLVSAFFWLGEVPDTPLRLGMGDGDFRTT